MLYNEPSPLEVKILTRRFGLPNSESLDTYLAWLGARLAVARECLAADGTLWLHLDHRAVHEAKVLCDRGEFA